MIVRSAIAALCAIGAQLAVGCGHASTSRPAADPGEPLLSGFEIVVQGEPTRVLDAAQAAVEDYGIRLQPLRRGRSTTTMDDLGAEVVVRIESSATGTELFVGARAAWTVPREILERIREELLADDLPHEPVDYPAFEPTLVDPVLVELRSRAER